MARNEMKKTQPQIKVIAIVPAAGFGRRFGSGINKPFRSLCGKPLVIWSLETLEAVINVKDIIPVLKTEDVEYGKKIFKEYGISKVKMIAPGGNERQDSVYNGLKLIEDKNCIVLIHDGARPLIEKDLIEKAIKELVILTSEAQGGRFKRGNGRSKRCDGVIFGVPLKDTIKKAENGMVTETLKRDTLWAIQTPQIFPYKTIFSAYEKAREEGFYSTDDAALVERYGGKLKVVIGSYKNIKITTPEDIVIAEFLISRKD